MLWWGTSFSRDISTSPTTILGSILTCSVTSPRYQPERHYNQLYNNSFYHVKIKLLMSSVTAVTKEKTARIIPNAVAVCCEGEKHIFTSFMSRDATFNTITKAWRRALARNDINSVRQEPIQPIRKYTVFMLRLSSWTGTLWTGVSKEGTTTPLTPSPSPMLSGAWAEPPTGD